MVKKVLDILQPTVDWIQEKLKTKFGYLVLGLLLGLIAPLSYINYQLKYIEEIKLNYETQKKEVERLIDERNHWQEKCFESENNCLQKMKSMTEFFSQLENTYREKYEKEQSRLTVNQQQMNQLNEIQSQLRTLQKRIPNEN